MARLAEPIDDRYGRGVRVIAWLQHDGAGKLGKRDLLKALGIRARKSYPVQARVKGESMVLRMEAHYSPYEKQSKGALRSYLERPDAAPDVLQEAAFEYHLDRWSIWITPSEHDVNPYVAVHALEQELEQRFGIASEDVYAVMHIDPPEKANGSDVSVQGWHIHIVVPSRPDMDLGHKVLTEIAKPVVRELVLERALERALDPARQRPVESGWDLPATDAQLAVLRAHGRHDAGLTRGEASLAVEAVIGERSWYARDR